MDRRDFLIGASLAALVAGCSSQPGSGSAPPVSSSPPSDATTPSGTATEVRSRQLRLQGGGTDGAVATVNGLGRDLYRDLAAARPRANLVLSPASIAIALAMVREGALGATATEMDDVLRSNGPAKLAPSMNALDQALAARSGARPDPSGTGSIEVTLKVANSLWGQQDTAWKQAFLDRLAQYFGAGLHLTDFRGRPQDARTGINTWVRGRRPDGFPSSYLLTWSTG